MQNCKERRARVEPVAPPAAEASVLSLATSDGQPYSAHQAERYERYQQVVALHQQGMKTKEIAKRVGLGMRTRKLWLTQEEYVETNSHHRHRSRFEASEASVLRRWDEGCHTIQQLWREIKAASDTLTLIRRGLAIWKPDGKKSQAIFPKPLALTTFRRKRPCGSSSVGSPIETKRSERSWQAFVRPVRRLRPSTSWFRSFDRWFGSWKENVLRLGAPR